MRTVSEGCVSQVKTPLNKEVGEAVRVCEKCRECKNDSVMLNSYSCCKFVSGTRRTNDKATENDEEVYLKLFHSARSICSVHVCVCVAYQHCTCTICSS